MTSQVIDAVYRSGEDTGNRNASQEFNPMGNDILPHAVGLWFTTANPFKG